MTSEEQESSRNISQAEVSGGIFDGIARLLDKAKRRKTSSFIKRGEQANSLIAKSHNESLFIFKNFKAPLESEKFWPPVDYSWPKLRLPGYGRAL